MMSIASRRSIGIMAAIAFCLAETRRETFAFVVNTIPRGTRQCRYLHNNHNHNTVRQQPLLVVNFLEWRQKTHHHQTKTDHDNSWNDEHLAHGVKQVHEESDAELKESEDAAAWDAHDCSDPGMEAAAEERAVIFAAEMVHKMKEENNKKKHDNAGDKLKKTSKTKNASNTSAWNQEHLAHDISKVHEETDVELQESEDAAAWDAHDCSDAGIEAAAEERAIMIAAEMAHKMKEKAAAVARKKETEN